MLHSGSLVGFLTINSSKGFETHAKNYVSENKWTEERRYFYRKLLTRLRVLDACRRDRYVVRKVGKQLPTYAV
jgi:hypothetical protein